jgi:hypothetical protein
VIPDEKDMLTVALKIEEQMHLHGWDQPGVLGVVMEADDDHLATMPYPVQPEEMPFENPAEALMHLADLTREMAAKGNLPSAEVADYTAGLWYCMEAWALAPKLEQEGVKNADTPGALECRIVAMIDCAGRAYRVQRIRGKEPSARRVGPDPRYEQTRVVIGLRGILSALGTVMSAGAIDLEAVALK